jgi:hypothetical protein
MYCGSVYAKYRDTDVIRRHVINVKYWTLIRWFFNSVKLKTELVKLVQIKKFYLYKRDSSYISLVAYLLVIIEQKLFLH